MWQDSWLYLLNQDERFLVLVFFTYTRKGEIIVSIYITFDSITLEAVAALLTIIDIVVKFFA